MLRSLGRPWWSREGGREGRRVMLRGDQINQWVAEKRKEKRDERWKDDDERREEREEGKRKHTI